LETLTYKDEVRAAMVSSSVLYDGKAKATHRRQEKRRHRENDGASNKTLF
jgi:hypothetical protein